MSVQNLTSRDPFADVGDDQFTTTQPSTKAPDYVHIRIQQRNGRKTLTTIQGLPSEYDPKKLLKAFKKDFACNGTLVPDEELGQVIQLQGDQRTKVSLLLVDAGIPKATIKAILVLILSKRMPARICGAYRLWTVGSSAGIKQAPL
ncbi:Eukaryotic translation initiation factor eIF-1 [Puccinia graminis f. sp. tritici]|uniref:Eukaryotic translation initiation factor eIF-1 n=1 Tax=Puccinia graminis f. sp. tritici TaxID=56615 RepID=A0A5B0QXW2_PUCGR|nr:Eukaryotic translation initiation factor eIF-1 [Puccinia graminis f. sp. tritici]